APRDEPLGRSHRRGIRAPSGAARRRLREPLAHCARSSAAGPTGASCRSRRSPSPTAPRSRRSGSTSASTPSRVCTGRQAGSAFATVRVATTLGALAGPPLGALLVYLGGWNAFLLGIAALGVAGAILTAVLIREAQPARASERQGSLREVLRDRPFALLLLSALLAFTDYCGFETVLPVIAVSMYGLAPSTWGLLFVISP